MIDNFPKRFFVVPQFRSSDITSFFDYFMNEFFTLISTLFRLLDSIEIYGVGLLNILITFFIVGLIVPIVLTIVHSRAVYSHHEKRREKRREAKNRDKGVYHADKNNTFIRY